MLSFFAEALVNANKAGLPKVAASQGLLSGAINAVLGLLGVVAVIFIVIGAIKYTISSGDAGATKSAKDTILYAVVGLVVAALSYGIVNFTLGRF